MEESIYKQKKALYTEIKKINNTEIKNFVKLGLDRAPHEFWESSSSGTGLYHPPEDQGRSGLIRHVIKCAATAKELCRYFNLPDEETDVVLAGTILHDIKKNGDPWGNSTHPGHGFIGAKFLEQFELKEPTKTEVINCVRYHMGRFTGPDKDLENLERERACKPNQKELIVQLSDFFCSRKYASFLPGISLKNEDIEGFFKKFY
jgi:putative nucleotidyltransferase with HDIG domain